MSVTIGRPAVDYISTGSRSKPLPGSSADQYRAVTRIRWVASRTLDRGADSVVVLAAMGLGAAPVHGLHSGNLMTAVPRQAAAALMLPASVWRLAGIGLGLVGLLTQASVYHLGCGRRRAAVNSFGTERVQRGSRRHGARLRPAEWWE
jgi:hypothetical protein